jgi:transcription initiation factor TFIIB
MSRAVTAAVRTEQNGVGGGHSCNLEECLRTVRHIAAKLNLGNENQACVNKAEEYCKVAINKKLKKEFFPNAFSAACVYLACREQGEARTFKEVCAVSKSSRQQLGHCYKALTKYLGDPGQTDAKGASESFIDRFCNELGLSNDILVASKTIFQKSVELDLVPGRSPISVIAAAIYLASQTCCHKKTPKMIAKVAGISHNTVRMVYKQMLPRAEELFPAGFHFETPIDELPLC